MKVFPGTLGTLSKESRYRFPQQVGEMMHGGLSVFGHPLEAAFYRPIGAYSVLPQTGSRSRSPIQPSEFRTFVLILSVPFCAAMRHVHGFPHTTHAKAAQSGGRAVTEAFTEHGRAWNTSPTPTLHPIFAAEIPCHLRIWQIIAFCCPA